MLRWTASALILTLAATVLAASADQIVRGEVSGPGWVHIRILSTDGSEPIQLAVGSRVHGPGVVGLHVREVGQTTSGSASWHNGISAAGGPASASVPGAPFELTFRTTISANDAHAVLYGLSASDAWWWEVTLPAAVQLERLAFGKDHFFWLGSGASDGIHVHGGLQYTTASFSDARYTFEIKHGLIGSAGAQVTQGQLVQDRLTLTLPDGTTKVCPPCRGPRAFEDWGPGDYGLQWQGASLGSQRILLAAVDVPGLPPLS
jgi:hypothetical protein